MYPNGLWVPAPFLNFKNNLEIWKRMNWSNLMKKSPRKINQPLKYRLYKRYNKSM